MSTIAKYLRYSLIVVAIGLCPAWPDLMGHARMMAPHADAAGEWLGALTGGVLANDHYLLLVGMFLGGLLLLAAPRMIVNHLFPTAVIAGMLGSISIVLYGIGSPAASAWMTVLTGVTLIVLYGASFYALSETAGYSTIAWISGFALAFKALLLSFVDQFLSDGAAFIAVCAVPIVCSAFLIIYRVQYLKTPVDEQDREGANDMRSYGRRTSVFMTILIIISSIVFAMMRATSNMQFWGSANQILVMPVPMAVASTVIFIVICYASFVRAPRDLMLRFIPCIVIQLVAYGLLWCGLLDDIGITGAVGVELFNEYTELYSHMYFFMVMFVALSMLGTAGVRVHGVQWSLFSASLFFLLLLGRTEGNLLSFIEVVIMNGVLVVVFLVAHNVYEQDQVDAIRAVSHRTGEKAVADFDQEEEEELSDRAVDAIAARYCLSEREREVLRLLVQGKTRAFMSSSMGVAAGTVATYVSRVYEKVRVHSKQELLSVVYDEVKESAINQQ